MRILLPIGDIIGGIQSYRQQRDRAGKSPDKRLNQETKETDMHEPSRDIGRAGGGESGPEKESA